MTDLAVDVESPRHRGHLAPQLAVDEVADPAEKQPQTRQGHREIQHVRCIPAATPGKQRDSYNDTDHPAMERHPAIPDLKGIHRVFGPEAHAVKQYIADATAQDDA